MVYATTNPAEVIRQFCSAAAIPSSWQRICIIAALTVLTVHAAPLQSTTRGAVTFAHEIVRSVTGAENVEHAERRCPTLNMEDPDASSSAHANVVTDSTERTPTGRSCIWNVAVSVPGVAGVGVRYVRFASCGGSSSRHVWSVGAAHPEPVHCCGESSADGRSMTVRDSVRAAADGLRKTTRASPTRNPQAMRPRARGTIAVRTACCPEGPGA